MNLYISDLHFGHANVIKFDSRPFRDVEEMDRCMIERWNGKVGDDDDVWIVGDFCHRSSKDPGWYLKQLKGRKHLIIGNHDNVILQNKESQRHFESIEKTGFVKDDGKQIILYHYPIAEWKYMRHGSWHVYGHLHNRRNDTFEFMKTRERALNAGAAINHYIPVSFSELLLNNRLFQEGT